VLLTVSRSDIMTFLRRVIGAAALDAATYEDVEADRMATLQAVLVVVLASTAAGIGATGLYDTAETLKFSAMATALALLTWVCWALVTLHLGARILPGAGTHADAGQMLRTLGFAAAPGLIQVFAALPGMVAPVFALAIGWTIAASVVAIRQALDYESTARALAVAALGWILALAVVVTIGLLFGPALAS
jgi:hypothetical protein